MNIDAVSTDLSAQDVSVLRLGQATTEAPAAEDANAAATSSPATSVSMSRRSQIFSALQKLQQTDPGKFKQVMSQMSDTLNAEAQQLGSGSDADRLRQLAAKFSDAAQSGAMPELRPSHRGGGQHHQAQSAYSAGSDAAQAAASSQSAPRPQMSTALEQALDTAFEQLAQAVGSAE